MKNIVTFLSLLFLSVLSGVQVKAFVKFPPEHMRCMLACLPPLVLHPTECRCVKSGFPDFQVCPQIQCPMLFVPCQKLKLTSNGCATCECQCSGLLSRCPTDCPFGTEHITDSDGCRVCRCRGRPQVCPQIRCAHPCPTGFLNDSRGCPSCTCKPFCPRPGPRCMVMKCAFGFETDQNGCQLCQCKPNPRVCGTVCKIGCPFGNVLDGRGCPLCKCKPRPKPIKCGPVCAIFCPFGNVLDARGCPTCRCKPGTWKEGRELQ